jgi:hypothetical protein
MKDKKIILTAWNVWMRLGAAILLLILAYGVLAPVLISNSESDFGVIAGMIVTWIAPPCALWILWAPIKQLFTYLKNN